MLSLIKYICKKTIKERELTANILYHKRFDISTEQFERIKHLLPQAKSTGRPPLDNYRTLNAIFWIMRTGAPWRDLPPDYGNWNSIYHKFRKWCKQNIFINILRELNSDKSVLIEMDSTYCKVHQLKTVDLTDKTVLADRAYGASDIREHICKKNALSCIPDKINSQIKHFFDKEVYKQRNIVERFFNKIKNNRHLAMRFDKLDTCFENFVVLAAIRMKFK